MPDDQAPATRHILVVDDEPDIATLFCYRFRAHLSEGRWNLIFAANGQEALEIVRSTPDLDLLITDLNMPVMDGLTLLRELAASRSDLKAIVISAYDDMGNIRQAMNQGALDFVTKPIDMMDLESTIDKTLELSAQLRQARRLELSRVEMEAASRAKSRFVADLSHEIRTPLNAIILYSELVRELAQETGADALIADLNKIVSTSKHLASLVDGILDLSKIEAGKMQLKFETFSVGELVRGVADALLPVALRNENRLTVRIAENVGVMHGDQTRVRQGLFNLLSNACKFTQGGRVTVDVRREGDDYVFDVADTGIGLTPQQIKKLFQPFTQADNKAGGTGLGLAIVSQFCRHVHGSVSVISEPRVGSTFTMRLPAMIAANEVT